MIDKLVSVFLTSLGIFGAFVALMVALWPFWLVLACLTIIFG